VHFDAGVVREEVNGKIFPERHEVVQVVFFQYIKFTKKDVERLCGTVNCKMHNIVISCTLYSLICPKVLQA
jgi:hypothetical protein